MGPGNLRLWSSSITATPNPGLLFSRVGAIRTPKASRRVSEVRPLLFPRTRTHRSSLNSEKTQWTYNVPVFPATEPHNSNPAKPTLKSTPRPMSAAPSKIGPSIKTSPTPSPWEVPSLNAASSGPFPQWQGKSGSALLKGYTHAFACNTGTNAFYLSTQLNSTGFRRRVHSFEPERLPERLRETWSSPSPMISIPTPHSTTVLLKTPLWEMPSGGLIRYRTQRSSRSRIKHP